MKKQLWVLLAGLLAGQSAFAVSVNQLDNFEDNSTMGWQKGPVINNFFIPTNQTTGGPNGLNDNYLNSISHGIGGTHAGDRQIIYNQSQWAGDYLTAGINSIKMDLQAFDTTPSASTFIGSDLAIRIAINSALGTKYGSSSAFNLTTDGQWHNASFELSDLVLISGTESLNEVLENVDTLRILSASNGPAWKGDDTESILGVDNISAVPLPAAVWLFISAFISLTSFKKHTTI